MKIVADENIPFVREVFSQFGRVVTASGREISPESVRDADILLVRSITKVNRKLLEGSRIKFVASSTIGTDHVDENYLREKDIGFANAPGSNANSVAEYIFAALFDLAVQSGWKLSEKTLAVVGVGHIGSIVAARAKALGMTVLENDPPLARQSGDPRFLPLEDVLHGADILTLHVPLNTSGPDKTIHLIDAEKLHVLKPETLVINASRGPVVDNDALKNWLEQRKGKSAAVLDVWENEPAINTELLQRVAIGTPHIAGYSLDGKINGVRMIYEAACAYFGEKPTVDPGSFLPDPPVSSVEIEVSQKNDEALVHAVIKRVYDIRADDGRLRKVIDLSSDERGNYFDSLRKNYPIRREFSNTRVTLRNGTQAQREKLKILGFQVN